MLSGISYYVFVTIISQSVFIVYSFINIIALHLLLLQYHFTNKHFWPYTKYNDTCLNYEKPGWPKLSSPM